MSHDARSVVQVVTGWNGMGISAFALASRALAAEDPPQGPSFPVDGLTPDKYLGCALAVARFVRKHLYDESSRQLLRSYREGPANISGGLQSLNAAAASAITCTGIAVAQGMWWHDTVLSTCCMIHRLYVPMLMEMCCSSLATAIQHQVHWLRVHMSTCDLPCSIC